jgi:hypothetical protein
LPPGRKRKNHQRRIKVFVDAKILNVHDPSLPREAFVGYVVEGDGRKGAKELAARLEHGEALESDDAEILAILFAVEELGATGEGGLLVVCDHESVVSEAKNENVKNPSPLMEKLRTLLRQNPSIKLEALQANPAHGVVTEYVNLTKRSQEQRMRVEGMSED